MTDTRIYSHPDWRGQIEELWPAHVFTLLKLEKNPPLNWLEIGSFEGRSALWTLDAILRKNPVSRITCVDPWRPWGATDYEKNFDHNIKDETQVIKCKGESREALPCLLSCYYDGIYVDGSHITKDVIFDAEQSIRLLKPNGVLIFDDYDWAPGGVKQAVQSFWTEHRGQLRIVFMGYQAIFQKVDKEIHT
jgi:predicted O-methyltransferase YrrM